MIVPGIRFGQLLLVLITLYCCPHLYADYEFITTAEVLNSSSATPPVTAEGWRTTVLPRAWPRDDAHPRDAYQAWYRIALPDDMAERGWNHLLMLRHMMNLELWLNGQFIGSGGPVFNPVQLQMQRNWNRPVLWTIPDSAMVLENSPQYLYVRLISEQNFGVMSPLFVGTGDSLRPRFAINYFVQITLVKISLMALLFIGCLSVFLWSRVKQRQWALMALMSACWSLPLLYILVPVLPIGEFTALRLSHWGVSAGACALLAFISSYYLQMRERLLRMLLPIPMVHAILLALAPNDQVVAVGTAGQMLFQILFVVLIVQLLRSPMRRNRNVQAVIAGLVIMLLVALHDVTLIASSTGARWRWDTPLSYITQPLMLVILAWSGISAFLVGVLDLAVANNKLQKRLDASELRIRQVFSEQERMEREIRVDAERELVYRDLHDDLGARLLSLVYQSEKGAAQDLARTALQDLRDIVSRVLAEEQSMSAVLADCMAEQLNRASVLGKELDWDIDDALDELQCPSQLILALRLLLRELVGGCLRIADAPALKVDLRVQDASLMIEITLAGNTAVPESMPLLPVLQKRLQAVDARLQGEGNQVRVRIPLAITQAAPS